MHLLHALSNPSPELERLFQSLTNTSWQQAPAPTVVPARTKTGHQRNRVIENAVNAVLAEATEPLRLRDIRNRVMERLGGPVAFSAVGYRLGNDPRHPARHIQRDAGGRYSAKRDKEV